MIFDNIEFHNVDHLQTREGMEGRQLMRFPEAVRLSLGLPEKHAGRFQAARPHGCELRFVTEAGFFDLALTSLAFDTEAVVYCGDMVHSRHVLKAGSRTVLHIEKPEILCEVDCFKLQRERFAPWVWRVSMGLEGVVLYHCLDTFGYGRRPPLPEEKPGTVWAAYGSSITCSAACALYSNCYVEQAAARLGVDVWNKGMAGACFCEPETADYLASLPADVVSLEVGVNMMRRFDDKAFKERTDYLFRRMKSSSAKRIFVIDMFPNKGQIALDEGSDSYRRYRSFKEAVREQVRAIGDERFVGIRGEDVLCSLSGLSMDLLHPSDAGHVRMGEKLAGIMGKYVNTGNGIWTR